MTLNAWVSLAPQILLKIISDGLYLPDVFRYNLARSTGTDVAMVINRCRYTPETQAAENLYLSIRIKPTGT